MSLILDNNNLTVKIKKKILCGRKKKKNEKKKFMK